MHLLIESSDEKTMVYEALKTHEEEQDFGVPDSVAGTVFRTAPLHLRALAHVVDIAILSAGIYAVFLLGSAIGIFGILALKTWVGAREASHAFAWMICFVLLFSLIILDYYFI